MAYQRRGIIRHVATCGAVAGLGILLSACDRPQPTLTATEEDWQQEQNQPARSVTQEQAPAAPAPERTAPTLPTAPGE